MSGSLPVRLNLSLTVLLFVSILVSGFIIMDTRPLQSAPDISEFSLSNGMKVIVIPDHRAPVVTHMVWYRVGAADELPGKSGIAHFLEHLMFKGTGKIKPGDFSKIIARNGGQDNAFTSQDATAYFQRVAKDRLPLIMEMEADRMTNLKLGEGDVITERKVILEERRSRVENDPSSILNEQMLASLYLSHPYGTPVIGWQHEMEALNLNDAVKFYKRYYAPKNAILVVAGDVDEGEVRKLAEQTYGKVETNSEANVRARPQEPEPVVARRIELVDPRAGQATIQRFYLAPSYSTAGEGEAEAMDLLMKIAASGTTSRMYKELVVKQKLASSAGGWYSGSGLDSGRIGVYGVSNGKNSVADIEEAIDRALEEIKINGVTQEELNRARNTYIAEYAYGADSQSSLARRYGWGLVNGRTVNDISKWPDRLHNVSVEDVQRAAVKYLDLKRSVTGVLLPNHPKAADTNSDVKSQSKS